MNPIVKNVLAVVAAIVIGSTVNMGFIMMSGFIIPPPEGADLKTMEGLTAAMPLMQPKHFLFPFLAHALGTLVGAFIVAYFSANNKFVFAMMIGLLFLYGGADMVMKLPSPMWFNVVDLGVAYLPMAFLGWKFSNLLLNRQKVAH